MSNKSEMTIGLNIVAEIGQFQNQMKVVQSELSKLGASNSLKESFEGAYKQIQEEIKKIQNLTQGEKISVADEKAVAKSFDTIKRLWKSTVSQMDSEKMKGTLLKEDQQAIDAILSKLKTYNSDVRKINNARSSGLQTLKQEKDTAKSNLEIAKQELKQLNDTKKSLNDQLKSAQDKVSAAKASREAADAEVKAAKTLAETTKEQFKEQYTKDHNDSSRGWNLEWEKIVRAAGAQEDFTEKTKRAAEALEQEKTAQKEVDDIQSKIDTNSTKIEDSTKNVKNLSQAHEDAKKALDAYKDATANLKTDRFEELKRTLFDIEKTKINWADFGVKPEDIKNTADLQKVMQDIADKGGPRAKETLDNLKVAIDNSNRASGEASSKFDSVRQSLHNMASVQSDIDRLTGRLIRFFSMDNAVRLFRRAIRSAVNTVKELDKVMTQTAVVTQYTVADMWKQLPEYTQRANELGLAVKDVYEASTLYYQQGLKTNEVVALTNATLRMARIAGLEAADATDRMTNALRGFNMELTEANADNVADVYSKLAAMSASNVNEISTAMTKVASLAHSANMEFENTAAFLAQIIETTRESAETAGTALKTVVARFSEVKNLYSKGELLGTDEEGEEIDVNKVSKALRTAGINLNEFLVGQKGLDDIFMELASKWDDLDIVQQRYIATMAAGSRQQSRFIALMSDYKRTVELTTAANNAGNASLDQYNKTLESVETKTNRLKNAWNEFLLGIANDQAIRFGLDAITNFLQLINSITTAISGGGGLIKAVANIGLTIGGLKLGKNILMSILGDPSKQVTGWFGKISMAMKAQNAAMVGAGTKAGLGFNMGFEKATKGGLKGLLSRTFGKTVTATQLGLQTVDFTDVTKKLVDSGKINQGLQMAIGNVDITKLTDAQRSTFQSLTTELNKGNLAWGQYVSQVKGTGIPMQLTAKQSDELGLSFENQAQAVNTARATMMGLGIVLTMASGWLEKLFGESNALTKSIKTIGVELLAIGAIFPILDKAIQNFATKASISISSIPIIGWIAALISAVTMLVTFVIEDSKKLETAAQKAAEKVEEVTELVNQTKEAVDNLNNSWDTLGEKQKEIEKLKKGTKEWNDAVAENNKLVLELMSKYEGLEISNKNGYLNIDNLDQILQDYNKRKLNSELLLQSASLEATKAARKEFLSNASDKIRYTQKGIGTRAAKIINADKALENIYQEGLTDKDDIFNRLVEQMYPNMQDAQERFKQNNTFDTQNAKYAKNDREIWAIGYGQSSDKLYQRILSDVQTLDEFDSAIKNTIKAIQSLAGTLVDTEVAQSEFADVYLNNTERVNQAIDTVSKQTNKGFSNTINEADFRKWVKETYGSAAALSIQDNGTFKVNGTKITYDQAKNDFNIWRATQQVAKEMESYVNELEKLGKGQEATKNALSSPSGENLTKSNILSWFNNSAAEAQEFYDLNMKDKTENQLMNEESEFYKHFAAIFEQDKELQDLYGEENVKVYIEDMMHALVPSMDVFFDKLTQLGPQLASKIEGLTSDSAKSIVDQILLQFAGMGDEFQASMFPDYKTLVKDADKYDDFLKAFSMLDFRNANELDEFSEQLQELGIVVDQVALDSYIERIKNAAKSLVQIDIDKFIKTSKDLAKVASDIRSGKQDRVFSEDTYNKLVESGIDVSQFTYRETGDYLYLGESTDRIVEAIEKQTAELTGTGREQLEAKAKAYDIAQEITSLETVKSRRYNGSFMEEYSREATQKEKDRDYIRQVLEAYGDDVGLLGIDGLLGNMTSKQLDLVSAKTLSNWVTQFKEIASQKNTWDKKIGELNDNTALTEQMKKTPQLIAATYGIGNADTTEAQKNALLSKMSTIVPEDVLDLFVNADWDQAMAQRAANLTDTYSQAETWGVESEQLQEMAQQYMETYDIAIDQASKAALENINLNTGLEAITNSYEDWSELLKKGREDETVKSTKQYQETIAELEKNIKQMFSIQGDLSSSFMNSKDTAELLEAAATGDMEAIKKLRIEAAKDIAVHFNISEDDKENFTTIQNELFEYIDSLDPSIDIRTQLDPASINDTMNFFNEMLKAGEITAEQMQDYFSAIGFVPTTEWDEKEVTNETFGQYDIIGADGQPKTIKYHHTETSTVAVPKITDLRYNGPDSEMHAYSPSISDTAKKNKEGKGGKESKKKDWKNPYDELYNLQEHINSALREREKLEAKYQRMLENHRTTGEELQKQSMKEIASLKKQLYYQEQMMAGRKKQMANVLNETYEDSEGNRKTYGSMGLQKYAWYEEDTQTVHIEWDKINQVTDEDQGKAIEAYVSRLEELRDQMQDVEDAIDEANDQIREIQMRNTEEYIDFEQRVYDALVNQYQREIDMLGEINQSVTDATNKTLDAISEEIEKERQARENEKAREELSDKEARLAYLQRDTSGMNALEIQKLQQELENERQSYQDSIVDQTLQEMRDEAARAEAQRQAQIDMMQGQLDWWQEVGYPLWEQVETLMNTGVDNTGKIISDSALDKLLTANDNVAAMSKIAAFKWTQDLAKEVAAQFEGFANWKMEMARDAGEVIDAKGKKYKYNASENKWYDENGNEVNVYYRDGKYVAEKIEKPKEVPVGSGGQQPGGGGTQTPPSTQPKTPPSGPPQTPPPETTLSDYDKKAFAALYLAGYYNQESLANEIGKNNAGQSISYGHGNYYLYDLFTQAVGGNTKWQSNNSWKKYMKGNTTWKKYAQGGLADFTGPAWLDGTKSHPEMVLNATDTQNLITLKNILGAILQNANNTSKTSTGDNYFDINIDAQISSDYDVDQLSERIKKQIYEDSTYRNVNTIHYIR